MVASTMFSKTQMSQAVFSALIYLCLGNVIFRFVTIFYFEFRNIVVTGDKRELSCASQVMS